MKATVLSGGEVRQSVTIANQRGLHARAAAKFVKLAGTFSAEIKVARREVTVSGLSIMGLMTLAAGLGARLDILASGADAAAAVEALVALVESKFDEDDENEQKDASPGKA